MEGGKEGVVFNDALKKCVYETVNIIEAIAHDARDLRMSSFALIP